MLLSIIIPLYNSEKFIPICLGSLLDQDLAKKDYEILIINDGSTDNSLDVASAFAEKYSNISVHNKSNGGVGSTRNMGLSLAKGEYIYFIDSDDYLMPNVLNTLLNTAKSNSLDILTFISKPITKLSLSQENSDTINPQISNVYNGIDYIANNHYQNEVWWYLIKRTFIEESEIKFIEDRWMEDAILTVQLFLSANSMAKLPLDAHRHVIVEGSAMTSKEPAHYLRVIDDNINAANVFESLIEDLEKKNADFNCIKRLRTRQQSFVFFSMIRMIKSTISFNKVKLIMNEMSELNAFPLNSFLGQDYSSLSYQILAKLLNSRPRFYCFFLLFNPFFRLKVNLKN